MGYRLFYQHPGINIRTVGYTTFFFSALPKSFQASLHGLITGGNLVEGVRATMRAGGCNASRGAFIAACFGAMVSEFFIGIKPM